MELIDRYVHAVGRQLPRKKRADIEAELRSALTDSPVRRQSTCRGYDTATCPAGPKSNRSASATPRIPRRRQHGGPRAPSTGTARRIAWDR